MKQVWQTVDGEVFENYNEAYDHESKFLVCDGIKMYDEDGRELDFINPSYALFIRISKDVDANELEKWKHLFIELDDDVPWDTADTDKAIKEARPGDFIYWDFRSEAYQIISERAQNAIRTYNLFQE